LQQDAVVAAVITASVAVIAAILSQVSTWTLEHHHRVYERRRSALLDVQDAALQVRGRLRDLGPAVLGAVERTEPAQQVEVHEDVRVSTARSDAEALLEVRLARVESGAVRDAVRAWQRAARFSFLGGDDDVTTADEEAAWASMNATVGDALTVPGWWATRLQGWRRRPVRRGRAPWR
jgi:hypothetical protein